MFEMLLVSIGGGSGIGGIIGSGLPSGFARDTVFKAKDKLFNIEPDKKKKKRRRAAAPQPPGVLATTDAGVGTELI